MWQNILSSSLKMPIYYLFTYRYYQKLSTRESSRRVSLYRISPTPLKSRYDSSHPHKRKLTALKESVLLGTPGTEPMLPTCVSGC